MKKAVITGLLVALSAPMFAVAQGNYYREQNDGYRRAPSSPTNFQDTANVTNVRQRYERVNVPQEECHIEVERVQSTNNGNQGPSIGGTLIGGVAGGILGNQVGGGSGKEIATAVGAVGGALVGNQIAGNMNAPSAPTERQVRRCRTVNQTQERATGFDVSYIYNGREYTTFMNRDPGRTVRVNVSVVPMN